MVLRFVSGPMLEKSTITGPLADRQKFLLTARFRASLFLGFSTTRETGNFQNISRNSGKFPESQKSLGFPGFGKFPKILAGNFFELDYFDIFSDFQHFKFNF